MYQSLVILNV